MAINFSDSVLAPAMNTFAPSVTIDPIRSQPGAEPYQARGVFTSQHVTVMMADGAAMTDIITTLGIRAADTNADGTPMFVVLPVRGDRITILDKALADSDFWVADRKPDGQGGHVLQLRREVLP